MRHVMKMHVLLAASACLIAGSTALARPPPMPVITADTGWLQLPEGQVMGEVAAVAVDASDHVWVLHRPGSIAGANRTRAAPPGGARPPSPAPEDAGNATLGYFMVG